MYFCRSETITSHGVTQSRKVSNEAVYSAEYPLHDINHQVITQKQVDLHSLQYDPSTIDYS